MQQMMTKVDFRRKKYLTMSFSQLLTNFSQLVFSYLHVNSDDITFASTAFGKHLYNLIDNLKEFFLFSSHTIKCFQNCSIHKHQRSDCTSKMPAKKHVKKFICTRLSFFFFFQKDECCEMLSITFLGKKKEIQEGGSGKQHSSATGLHLLACLQLGLSVICIR